MPSSSLSENAESAELQRLIAVEQQKAQFQAQVTSETLLILLTFNNTSIRKSGGFNSVWRLFHRFTTLQMFAGISAWKNRALSWIHELRLVSLAAWSVSSTRRSQSPTASRRWCRRARTDWSTPSLRTIATYSLCSWCASSWRLFY